MVENIEGFASITMSVIRSRTESHVLIQLLVLENSDTSALQNDVVCFPKGSQIRPYAGDIEHAQIGLVPRQPIGGIRVEEELNVTILNFVASPVEELEGSVRSTESARVAIIYARFPISVLLEQRLLLLGHLADPPT